MGYKVFEFDAAIVRRPAESVTAGIRAYNRGDPSYEGVKGEHAAYVAALQGAGVEVDILEALDAFPDSIFVEDPALVFSAGAIVLRPGVKSRLGEAEFIRPVLERHFTKVLNLARGSVGSCVGIALLRGRQASDSGFFSDKGNRKPVVPRLIG